MSARRKTEPAPARLTYTLRTAYEATGLSRSYWERLCKSGEIQAAKSGVDSDGNPAGSWVIPADAVEAWIKGLMAS